MDDLSLVLYKDDAIVHKDTRTGLRPIIELIRDHRDLSGHILFDKVIGLASARLICLGRPDEVKTNAISLPAKKHFEECGIKFQAEVTIDNIMNMDRTDICPMEAKAMNAVDDKSFFYELLRVFKYS